MDETREALNRFLVDAFHGVLRAEERYLVNLGFGDLSISEMHVIEACVLTAAAGSSNAKDIAKLLGITPGSLSISVNVLEKKGYLRRARDVSDHRRIHITPTDKGLKADAVHRRVHDKMIDGVLGGLKPEQAEALMIALKSISLFFADERTGEHD